MNQQNQQDDFEAAAKQERRGFLAEYVAFVKSEGKYWLIPLLVVLVALGAIVAYSGAAAPFIYTLF